MKNEILSLLGKRFSLTTCFDDYRHGFVIKVSHRPTSAFDMSYIYSERIIPIHDIVYTNTDILVATIQSCINELEANNAEEPGKA